ncbi:MAG: hypothetical protein M3N19_11770 [Candidatus Eremiobacteraeota bacterium]|nr:hypothetical protein [Candidatus Eremiobacteraeota bacterium]
MIFSAVLLAATTLSSPPVQPAAPAPVYAHHVVSTTDKTAQELFDRGLTLYYAYNGSEAVHVFQSAEKADPKLAMAYWGEALAYGPDINQGPTEARFKSAHAAIEKAAQLESSATPSEQALIEAMRLRYAGSLKNYEKPGAAYRSAMAAAYAKFLQDDDIGALYAEALLENSGVAVWKAGTSIPSSNDAATMTSVLDEIVLRNPAHIMANHLLVHLFEYSTDRSRAVLAADRLNRMSFAPEDEHLAHMPAHTFVDVGRYHDAVDASQRAIALFDAYLATPGIDPDHKSYIWHDIRVGYGAAMMLGNYASAQWFLARLEARPDSTPLLRTLTAARFGHWADLDPIKPSGPADPAHFALAYHEIAQGLPEKANAELVDALDTKSAMSYLLYALRGAAQVLQNHTAQADAQFQKALTAEKDHFGGENIPVFPTNEIMGSVYLRSGDYARSEAAYREALALYPSDPRALYGLSEALRKEGKTAQAQATAQNFAALWKGSDTALTPASI